MEKTVARERKYWIDWMKVIGMWAFVGFVRLVSNRAPILLGGRKIKE